MQSFLSRVFGTKLERDRLPRGKAKPGRRLGLEALEQRMLCSVGEEFHVNTTTTGDQWRPDVACQPIPNGRCVVVWVDYGLTPPNIRGQIYDGNGVTIRSIRLPTITGSKGEPSVAMDAQGNFVVVWTQYVNMRQDVMAWRYTADGGRVGLVIPVATDARPEYSPSVAMDSYGNFVVSYTVKRFVGGGSTLDIHASMYPSSGMLPDSSFVVAKEARNETNSVVARSPDGRFSIAYEIEGFFSSSDSSDIVLNQYAANGALLTVHDIDFPTFGSNHHPDVAMDSDGNTIVVFETRYSGTWIGNIFARKVDRNGNKGSLMDVGDTRGWAQPTVAMDLSDGDFVVAYERGDRVVVGEMNSTGTVKSEVRLADDTELAALSINASGGYFLAYVGEEYIDYWNTDIFARRGLLV